MAVLPLWSCLLVSYFSVSLAELSNLSDLYPPLWEESPGQFSDYQVENGTYIIDPWVYTDRLGMYKILINKTATYFEKYAPENEQNILWGLPVQHGWQYRTVSRDVTKDSQLLEYLSKPEANFGRNWATAVKYLGASLFPTTLIRVHEFQKGLPSRMFVNGDRGPFISDFTNFQNTVLLSLNLLYKVDNSIGSLSLPVWKTLMKTHEARKLFLEFLEIIVKIFNSTFLDMINELKMNDNLLSNSNFKI
nr:protein LEG1 homolog [Manis javanica]